MRSHQQTNRLLVVELSQRARPRGAVVLIEVLSDSTRRIDLCAKRREYAALEVPLDGVFAPGWLAVGSLDPVGAAHAVASSTRPAAE